MQRKFRITLDYLLSLEVFSISHPSHILVAPQLVLQFPLGYDFKICPCGKMEKTLRIKKSSHVPKVHPKALAIFEQLSKNGGSEIEPTRILPMHRLITDSQGNCALGTPEEQKKRILALYKARQAISYFTAMYEKFSFDWVNRFIPEEIK